MNFQAKTILGTTLLALLLSLSVYETFVGTKESILTPSKEIPASIHTLFSKWKAAYGITYPNPQENNQRLQVFYDSVRKLGVWREKNPLGKYKLTPFADISDTEFLNFLKRSTPKNIEQPKNLKMMRNLLKRSQSSQNLGNSSENGFNEHSVLRNIKNSGELNLYFDNSLRQSTSHENLRDSKEVAQEDVRRRSQTDSQKQLDRSKNILSAAHVLIKSLEKNSSSPMDYRFDQEIRSRKQQEVIDSKLNVKNLPEPQSQGYNGSCYAFAIANALSTAIIGQKISAQHFLDCSKNEKLGNMISLGGEIEKDAAYVLKNYGYMNTLQSPYSQIPKKEICSQGQSVGTLFIETRDLKGLNIFNLNINAYKELKNQPDSQTITDRARLIIQIENGMLESREQNKVTVQPDPEVLNENRLLAQHKKKPKPGHKSISNNTFLSNSFKSKKEIANLKEKERLAEQKFKAELVENKDKFLNSSTITQITGNLLTPFWIKEALNANYALAIYVNSGSYLKLFAGGVSYNDKTECSSRETNHAVTLVGYRDLDETIKKGAWIIRESWTKALLGDIGRSVHFDNDNNVLIPWRDNFYDEHGGKCFCGGEGEQCTATLFSKAQFKPTIN